MTEGDKLSAAKKMIREECFSSLSYKEIAEHIGCVPSTVSRASNILGIKKRSRRAKIPITVAEIKDLRNQDVSVSQIAKDFKCSETAVYWRLKNGDLPKKVTCPHCNGTGYVIQA